MYFSIRLGLSQLWSRLWSRSRSRSRPRSRPRSRSRSRHVYLSKRNVKDPSIRSPHSPTRSLRQRAAFVQRATENTGLRVSFFFCFVHWTNLRSYSWTQRWLFADTLDDRGVPSYSMYSYSQIPACAYVGQIRSRSRSRSRSGSRSRSRDIYFATYAKGQWTTNTRVTYIHSLQTWLRPPIHGKHAAANGPNTTQSRSNPNIASTKEGPQHKPCCKGGGCHADSFETVLNGTRTIPYSSKIAVGMVLCVMYVCMYVCVYVCMYLCM